MNQSLTRWLACIAVVSCACGPGRTGSGGEDTASETGDLGGSDTSASETGTGDGIAGDDDTTGGDDSQCYGGADLGFGAAFLEPQYPVDGAIWDGYSLLAMACVVGDVSDDGDYWTALLDCTTGDELVSLDWRVPKQMELLDPTWVGKSLSVVGHGQTWGANLEGWLVVRDENEELVWISGGPTIPEPEYTWPITIEQLDASCGQGGDDCTLEYEYPLLFSSEIDGELQCYQDGGHVTDSYIYIGRVTQYVPINRGGPFDPNDECEIYDQFLGTWAEYIVVRR